jgi:hypothetical protein
MSIFNLIISCSVWNQLCSLHICFGLSSLHQRLANASRWWCLCLPCWILSQWWIMPRYKIDIAVHVWCQNDCKLTNVDIVLSCVFALPEMWPVTACIPQCQVCGDSASCALCAPSFIYQSATGQCAPSATPAVTDCQVVFKLVVNITAGSQVMQMPIWKQTLVGIVASSAGIDVLQVSVVRVLSVGDLVPNFVTVLVTVRIAPGAGGSVPTALQSVMTQLVNPGSLLTSTIASNPILQATVFFSYAADQLNAQPRARLQLYCDAYGSGPDC